MATLPSLPAKQLYVIHMYDTCTPASLCMCISPHRLGRIEEAMQEPSAWMKQLMEENSLTHKVILVATHTSQDRMAKKERQRLNLTLEALLQSASAKLGAAFGLQTHPPCYDIDTAAVRLPCVNYSAASHCNSCCLCERCECSL